MQLYTRRTVLAACLLVQLVIGTSYGWGSNTVYITSWLRTYCPTTLYRDTIFVFGAGMLGISCGGLGAGYIVDHWPYMMRWVVTVSMIVFCVSVALTPFVRAPWPLIMVLGVSRGIGGGAAHVGPVMVGQQWFPQQLNLINGVTASVLGISALPFNLFTSVLMNPDNLNREDLQYAVQDIDDKWYYRSDSSVVDHVPSALWTLAGVLFVLGVPAGLFHVYPPNPDMDLDNDGPVEKALAATNRESTPAPAVPLLKMFYNYTVGEAARRWELYLLCSVFVLTSMPGHIVFAVYKTYARGMDDRYLTTVGSIGAGGNAVGRLFWGFTADQLARRLRPGLGEKVTLILMMVVQTSFLATFGLSYILETEAPFMLWTFMCKACYGGCFAIFPALTCKMFGIGNFGVIYGFMMLAWGVAGIAGDILVNQLEEYLDALPFFLLFAGVSFTGLLGAAFLQYPKHNDPQRRAVKKHYTALP